MLKRKDENRIGKKVEGVKVDELLKKISESAAQERARSKNFVEPRENARKKDK